MNAEEPGGMVTKEARLPITAKGALAVSAWSEFEVEVVMTEVTHVAFVRTPVPPTSSTSGHFARDSGDRKPLAKG